MDEHTTNTTWSLYMHYINDNNWDTQSYKLVDTVNTIEKAIVLFTNISESLLQRCMFFLMRNNIKPLWEEPENAAGGAFSFKVHLENVKHVYKCVCYQAIGETLFCDMLHSDLVTGITLSPKKNFGILKVWTKSCDIQNPSSLRYFDGFTSQGCIFKKHNTR